MNTRRRLTKGLIRPKGSFRLARWASHDDNTRRLQAYLKRLKAARLRDPKARALHGLACLRLKRQWRGRAGAPGAERARGVR